MGEFQPLFEANCGWVANLADDHAWSDDISKWLGPVNVGMCLDTRDRVVAWTPGGSISGIATPIRPMRAVRARGTTAAASSCSSRGVEEALS